MKLHVLPQKAEATPRYTLHDMAAGVPGTKAVTADGQEIASIIDSGAGYWAIKPAEKVLRDAGITDDWLIARTSDRIEAHEFLILIAELYTRVPCAA
ncbi:Uncharacterised protein [Mycobacteroides abscessus subsp. abscessus]|uniref:hypothetical protein n=1 Tax=Mycobacteroides abscessus TaxID=36809 RepID=UPI0009A78323|nr:hypothetical protein [Mycobacteroides abscessus]SKO35778.1 Uncharacterised protein [Mycobacteroides abscessus subsp. abscessus]